MILHHLERDLRIGIVGLNSAWRQFTGGNFERDPPRRFRLLSAEPPHMSPAPTPPARVVREPARVGGHH